MSRLLKLIASALVLAAGGAVAVAAGSAPAQTRAHMIICPLEPNDTITTPCCGPPIVTAGASGAGACCGTPQPIACPVGLTLSPSANPSIAGEKITLSGRWPGGSAGHTVNLFQKLPGAKAFSRVARTKTVSLGEFRFVRKGVETNREWYVAVGSERSVTIDQRVKAVVTLTTPGSLRGQVIPNHADDRVWVEEQTSGHWTVIARPRLSRGSTYHSTGCQGRPVRVVFPGDGRNVRSASADRMSACSGY